MERLAREQKLPPVDAQLRGGPNTRKDLDKVEKCAGCKKDFPRYQMRGGADQGVWYCLSCWEEKHGYPAPPDKAAERHAQKVERKANG